MYHDLYIVINNCMKGKNVHLHTLSLLNDIKYIIDCFNLHQTTYYKAYSYGASANTYLTDNDKVIVKVYNDKLRWNHEEHNNIDDIFNKEVEILKKLGNSNDVSISRIPQLIEVNDELKMIKMAFLGTSLFDNFYLPSDWKEQLTEIFDLLTEKEIEYPEFNIKNILVCDNKLSMVDFGLARFYKEIKTEIKTKNNNHLLVFIEILDKLKEKFEKADMKQINVLYQTFLNNMKIENKYTDNIF